MGPVKVSEMQPRSLQCSTLVLPTPVPGPVESFTATAVSSVVILLSWTPPLSPNGRITGYILIYSATLPSGAVQNGSEFIRSSSAGALIISDLEEDVLYQFTLQAETSAGQGEGRTTTARTEEDSECLVTMRTFLTTH